MDKMNPEAKAKIVEALRSGDFKQSSLYLRVGDCHCVWGVITEVSGKANWKVCGEREGQPYYDSDGGVSVPRRPVQEWAGIGWPGPAITIDGKTESISSHNDGGVPFDKIAAAIEEQL